MNSEIEPIARYEVLDICNLCMHLKGIRVWDKYISGGVYRGFPLEGGEVVLHILRREYALIAESSYEPAR